MICPTCGKYNKEGVKFCTLCGKRLNVSPDPDLFEDEKTMILDEDILARYDIPSEEENDRALIEEIPFEDEMTVAIPDVPPLEDEKTMAAADIKTREDRMSEFLSRELSFRDEGASKHSREAIDEEDTYEEDVLFDEARTMFLRDDPPMDEGASKHSREAIDEEDTYEEDVLFDEARTMFLRDDPPVEDGYIAAHNKDVFEDEITMAIPDQAPIEDEKIAALINEISFEDEKTMAIPKPAPFEDEMTMAIPKPTPLEDEVTMAIPGNMLHEEEQTEIFDRDAAGDDRIAAFAADNVPDFDFRGNVPVYKQPSPSEWKTYDNTGIHAFQNNAPETAGSSDARSIFFWLEAGALLVMAMSAIILFIGGNNPFRALISIGEPDSEAGLMAYVLATSVIAAILLGIAAAVSTAVRNGRHRTGMPYQAARHEFYPQTGYPGSYDFDMRTGTRPDMQYIDQIRGLKELLDDGIITEEEFEAKKKFLLGL